MGWGAVVLCVLGGDVVWYQRKIQMKFFSLLRFPLLCSLFAGLASGSANSQTVANFTVKDIDGITHQLYNYTASGKYVLLDFFAYSCGPCYSASENISGLYTYYGCNQNDIVVLCIGRSDTDSALTRSFADQASVIAPIVPGPAPFNGQNLFGSFGVTGIPTLRLISPNNQLIPLGLIETLPHVLDSLGVAAPPTPCAEALADLNAQVPGTITCSPAMAPITLYNQGNTFIRSFNYEYSMDGQPVQTGTWTGELWPNVFSNNSAALHLPLPVMADRSMPYYFNVTSINGGVDAFAANDLLNGVQEFKFIPTDLNHVEDFEAFPLTQVNQLYREATWWSMPKWKQGPYSYNGGSSCIMLQGDSVMMTQAYNDQAKFTVAYEWIGTPMLGDTPRVVFDVACGAGNSVFSMHMGNHCDFLQQMTPNYPIQMWATSQNFQFFPQSPAEWRTIKIDIPTGYLTNTLKELYIQWNMGVGWQGTLTPNIFIDNIRFEDLAVQRVEPGKVSGLQLWPNPGTSVLRLSRNESQGAGVVRMFSSNGQQVGIWHFEGERMEIATENLPSGLYLVEMRTDEGVEVQRWVKE